MKVAVNYSTATVELLQKGQIELDYFKCPAWLDLTRKVQEILPAYVHFPLKAGLGIGDAIETETNQPANWQKVEQLLAQTSTPFINIHLSPTITDFPQIPSDTQSSSHIEMLTSHFIKDVQSVVKRFGAERVIIENDHDSVGVNLRPAFLPEVIYQVVEETQCGFLLDLSHARLAAIYLGMDTCEYINALPVAQIREIHVSGVQMVEGHWLDLLGSFDDGLAERFGHRLLDHLPMTDEDWQLVEWSMQQIREGNWSEPWVVAMECGGTGPIWELITFRDVLEQQVPYLYKTVKGQDKSERTKQFLTRRSG